VSTEVLINNALGSIGANLTSSGTTITFANPSANPIPTLTSGEFVKIALDPGLLTYEITYLEGPFTSGATTGTILRGQEGTTGQAHTSGGVWLSGPTVASLTPGGDATGYLYNLVLQATSNVESIMRNLMSLDEVMPAQGTVNLNAQQIYNLGMGLSPINAAQVQQLANEYAITQVPVTITAASVSGTAPNLVLNLTTSPALTTVEAGQYLNIAGAQNGGGGANWSNIDGNWLVTALTGTSVTCALTGIATAPTAPYSTSSATGTPTLVLPVPVAAKGLVICLGGGGSGGGAGSAATNATAQSGASGGGAGSNAARYQSLAGPIPIYAASVSGGVLTLTLNVLLPTVYQVGQFLNVINATGGSWADINGSWAITSIGTTTIGLTTVTQVQCTYLGLGSPPSGTYTSLSGSAQACYLCTVGAGGPAVNGGPMGGNAGTPGSVGSPSVFAGGTTTSAAGGNGGVNSGASIAGAVGGIVGVSSTNTLTVSGGVTNVPLVGGQASTISGYGNQGGPPTGFSPCSGAGGGSATTGSGGLGGGGGQAGKFGGANSGGFPGASSTTSGVAGASATDVGGGGGGGGGGLGTTGVGGGGGAGAPGKIDVIWPFP
jgi:hypothetical protein